MVSNDNTARGPVLVVDDDDDIREIITLALATHGYRVITAVSGADCLRRITVERPCLILLDMMMPDLNGWDVCERLKLSPSSSSIPVVILTGNVRVEDERSGTTPILHKPIQLDALVEVIERYASPLPVS
jgi:CheY-like chemotaxis protein